MFAAEAVEERSEQRSSADTRAFIAAASSRNVDVPCSIVLMPADPCAPARAEWRARGVAGSLGHLFHDFAGSGFAVAKNDVHHFAIARLSASDLAMVPRWIFFTSLCC